MARSSGNPLHSQQQPASPKHAVTTTPEPKVIAGPEVLDCELSVFQTEGKHAEWWDGKVTEFNSDSGQHLVWYHGREHRTQQWLQLSDQPFQWKSTPPSTAAPNPTVEGIKLNDSLLGRKVKVFWPAMSKWYLGHIKEFDAKTGRHTIKYRDGEVKDHNLRHEAVWWLESNTDLRVAVSSNRSKGLSAGSHSANQGAHKQPAHSTGRTAAASTDSPNHRQKHTLASEASQATLPAAVKPLPPIAEAVVVKGGATSSKARQKSGAAASLPETGTDSGLSSTGDRSADDDSISQSSCSRGPADTAFADMQDDEEQLPGPTSRHAPNPAAKLSRLATLRQGRSQNWTQLAGENKPGRKPATPRGGETAAGGLEDGAGESIVGARVGIFWADDQIFYKGELSGFDAYRKRSKVCYDDGQEEWVSLMQETFRWYTPRGKTAKHYNPRMRDIMLELGALDLASQPPHTPNPSGPTQTFAPDQRPGLSDNKAQSDSASTASAGAAAAAFPSKGDAVGWGVSVFSHAEGRFVRGQVIAFGKKHQHHVLYEDGEDEWLRLAEEDVQWHSHKCSIAQTAGLQKVFKADSPGDNGAGTRTPKGLSTVGWRIGVYWTIDQEFYYGKVVHYDKDEETQYKYSIKYDDEEEEDVDLTEQPMKWVLPPHVAGSSETPDEITHRLRSKAEPSSSKEEPMYEPVRAKRQPGQRRHANGSGVERQKSRLGINRAKSGIRKEGASTPRVAPLVPSLPLSTGIPSATLLHSDVASPAVTAVPSIATAVAAAPASAPVLLNSASTSIRLPTAAQQLPSLAPVGLNMIPRLDRIVGPVSRRAPHLAGTRVKIFCSHASRGIKSSPSLTHASGQDANARRVKRRLEAVNQMIWRCECADTAITKGAPIPPTAQDAAKHLPLAFPVPASTVSRVAAHLGIAPSPQLQPVSHGSSPRHLSPSQQLPATSAAASQLPADRQLLHEVTTSQSLQLAASQPDESDLIHQLPGSAPMLLDDSTAVLMSLTSAAAPTSSAPPSSFPQGWPTGSTNTDADALRTAETQHAVPHSRHVSPRPPSSSPSGSLLGLSTSRQASPSSASLAELVPSTTAVTVPPYSVISAAKAGSVQALYAPVVMADDAVMLTSDAQEGRAVGRGAGLAVRLGLRGQASFGVPDTPDQENLVLNRERSSLSKDQADALRHNDYMHDDDMGMDTKRPLSASGMIDLAMSDAPPGEIEPEMFAFLLDNDAFEGQKLDVTSRL